MRSATTYPAPADLDLIEQAHSPTGLWPKADSELESLKFRREIGTISRHSGVFFFSTTITAGAGYLFKIYVARKLGAESLGVYSLGMAVVSLLGLLGAMGLPTAAPRFVAAYSGTGRLGSLRAFLGRGVFLLMVTGSLLGVLTFIGSGWISGRIFHTPSLTQYMPMFGMLVFTSILATFCEQVLAGFKDVARRTVITNLIGTPLMMVLAVVLITIGTGLRGFIAAQAVSSAIVVSLLLRTVWKLTPPAVRSFTAELPRMGSEVTHYCVGVLGVGVLEFLLSQADKVLLGVFLDAKLVGIYAVATALVAFVPIVLSTVNQIFSPTIAELHARGERELLARLYQTLTKWIFGLTIPLAAVMILFAAPLMRMFGNDFEAGWPILVIGSIGQLVNCAVGSVGFLLLMSGNQRRLIKVQTVMAAAMVLLNVLLIPWLGVIGAALVGGGVNVVSNLWYLAEVRGALGLSPYNRSYFGLVAPSVTVTSLLALFRYAGHSSLQAFWIVVAVAGSYLVFVVGMLLFGLDSDDRFVLGALSIKLRQILRRAPEVPSDAILA